MNWLATVLALLLVTLLPARAQHEMPEFVDAAERSPAATGAPAATAEASSDVVAEPVVESLPAPVAEDSAPTANETRAAAAATGKPPAGASVDLSAYEEVLKENLDLRKKIDESSRNEETIRRENEKLARAMQAMEEKVRELSGDIDRLGKEKQKAAQTPQDLDRVVDLEAQLSAAQAEKVKLGKEIEEIKSRVATQAAAAAVVSLPPPTSPGVKPDSDLFKKLEKENILLKQKLEEVEGERQQAVKGRGEAAKAEAKRQELERDLARAKAGQEQERQKVQKLLDRLPDIEKELTSAQSTASGKDSALAAKAKDVDTLRLEIERRENRLIKAERMAALLEKTREEIRQVSDKEKRDMHYNMAAVYAKEGRYRDAEGEYLKALRIDPADADSHYNLAILYDDELQDKRKAAMHYRRYLKLRPNAPDVDGVKNWLMDLEMGN